MRILHNSSALNTFNKLNNTNKGTSKSLEKLSSGLRINKAADDAAGLAISEKMRAQIRGLAQAERNVQDGVSLIQTAEGGLGEIQNNLQRVRELCIQASNDTLTNQDRQHIQKEIEQIKQGINDIANNTEFNGINLLNSSIQISSPAANTNSGVQWNTRNSGLSFDIITEIEQINGKYYATAVRGAASNGLILTSTDGLNWSVPSSSEVNSHLRDIAFNGSKFVVIGPGDDISVQNMILTSSDGTGWVSQTTAQPLYSITADANKFVSVGRNGTILTSLDGTSWTNQTSGTSNTLWSVASNGSLFVATGSAGTILTSNDGVNWTNQVSGTSAVLTKVEYIDNKFIAMGSGGTLMSSTDGINWTPHSTGTTEQLIGITSNGTEIVALGNNGTIISSVDGGSSWKAQSSGVTDRLWDIIPFGNGFMAVGEPDGKVLTTGSIHNPSSAASGNSTLNLQVGANSGDTFTVTLTDARTTALGMDDVDLSTRQGAASEISKVDEAAATVSSARSKFGAYQNALEHIHNNVSNYELNLTAAESRISDVDMAKEMMELTKSNMLSQATQAMLAQANQQPQGVLQILKSS